MRRRTVLGLIGCSPFIPLAQSAVSGPIAQTIAGKVRGYANGPVSIFKGIPYGDNTAGTRFLPARKPKPWSGVRDARLLGNRAPQNPPVGLIPEEAVAYPNEPMSEECLFLNVWTAGLQDGRKRPVMVWLHGGGYSAGSGGQDRYDGSRLASIHDVVVVTLNHRLNIFGHLYLADIRDNIAEFGGDPGRVTVFGESGGGGKVLTLMAMPAAAGLFHRAIAQSGIALRQATPEAAAKDTAAILKQLGLTPSQWQKLLTMPEQQLLAAIREMRPGPRFTPVGGRCRGIRSIRMHRSCRAMFRSSWAAMPPR
jgi:para-nitrobenzyl esterase